LPSSADADSECGEQPQQVEERRIAHAILRPPEEVKMKKLILCVVVSLLFLHPASGQEGAKFQSDLITLNMLISIGLNLSVGFGIGSFIQGDWLGGIIQLTGETVGWCIVGWYIIEAVAKQREPGEEIPAWFDLLGNAAACLAVGARGIWGVLRPIRYAALKRALLNGQRITFDIAPATTPSADSGGFDFGVEFSLRCTFD
jgi:hypothetical protein